MSDQPADGETVYSPDRDGGGRRVRPERPAVPPAPDHSGRAEGGPKVARFDPDEIDDDEMRRGHDSASGSGPTASSGKRRDRPGDDTFRRFLDA